MDKLIKLFLGGSPFCRCCLGSNFQLLLLLSASISVSPKKVDRDNREISERRSVLLHPLVAVGVVAVVDPNIVAAASCF